MLRFLVRPGDTVPVVLARSGRRHAMAEHAFERTYGLSLARRLSMWTVATVLRRRHLRHNQRTHLSAPWPPYTTI
eukprot:SAG11_NODE_1155_length_5660_cov_6.290955_2_plen_75_part_00